MASQRAAGGIALLMGLGLIGCQSATTPAAAPSTPAPATQAALPPPTPCAKDAGWSDPTAPRHVFGNTWFVGTCSIGAFLITSPQGHVLIDAATAEAAPHIAANIRAAGFNVGDIKTILVTHEHNDHVGGVAELQRLSGATVLARPAAADALKRGIADRRDPQFEVAERFPPVAKVRVHADGQPVVLGPLRIDHLPGTGHTAGGSGWAWTSCEGEVCRRIVYPDSVSAISDKTYRYSDHPAHVAAFQQTLATIAAQRCDILLTTHVQASDMLARLDGQKPLVDAGACKAYATRGLQGLEKRLTDEHNGAAP